MNYLLIQHFSGNAKDKAFGGLMNKLVLADGFSAEKISREIAERISGVSYHENDKIKLSDLAYLKVLHIDFNGKTQQGELICNKNVAKELLKILTQLSHNMRYLILVLVLLLLTTGEL